MTNNAFVTIDATELSAVTGGVFDNGWDPGRTARAAGEGALEDAVAGGVGGAIVAGPAGIPEGVAGGAVGGAIIRGGKDLWDQANGR